MNNQRANWLASFIMIALWLLCPFGLWKIVELIWSAMNKLHQ